MKLFKKYIPKLTKNIIPISIGCSALLIGTFSHYTFSDSNDISEVKEINVVKDISEIKNDISEVKASMFTIQSSIENLESNILDLQLESKKDPSDKKGPIKILCIDGGGVRGIVPAIILQELHKSLGFDHPFHENFDMIAGTSTGSILAVGLVAPHNNDPKKPKFSPFNLVNFYREASIKIFPLPHLIWVKLHSIAALFGHALGLAISCGIFWMLPFDMIKSYRTAIGSFNIEIPSLKGLVSASLKGFWLLICSNKLLMSAIFLSNLALSTSHAWRRLSDSSLKLMGFLLNAASITFISTAFLGYSIPMVPSIIGYLSYFYLAKAVQIVQHIGFTYKYSRKSLDELLRNKISFHMKDSLLPTVVIAYDLDYDKPQIFYSLEDGTCNAFDLVAASTAAPTYLRPFEFHNYKGETHRFVDGGLVANNPSLCAYILAKKRWPDRDIYIFSLGTGKSKTEKKTFMSGLIASVKDIIEITTDADLVEKQLDVILERNHFRLQVDLGGKNFEMDDSKEETLMELEKITLDYITKNKEGIQKFQKIRNKLIELKCDKDENKN